MSDPREQLRQRLQHQPTDARQKLRERLAAPEDEGAGVAFGQSAFNRYVNNVLNLGNVAVNAVIRGLPHPAANLPPGSPARVRYEESLPDLGDRTVIPTIQDIGAATRSIPSLMPGGETPGEAFSRNREQIAAEDTALREAHPVASRGGDITGDIATLITGRAPVANLVRRAEQRFTQRPDLFFGAAPRMEPTIRRTANRTLNSPAMKKLARGIGRSGETGLEAAVLEVLKGEEADPLEAAAFAASGQMVGSSLLQSGKGILSGGPTRAGLKVGLTAVAVGSLWQLGKSATPGGRDFILESTETGFDKVKWSLALGALAAMAGAGRGRSGQLAEEMSPVVDVIATIPRGGALSIITDIANMEPDEQEKAESVLNSLASDPDYEGRDETERRLVERIRELSEQAEEPEE